MTTKTYDNKEGLPVFTKEESATSNGLPIFKPEDVKKKGETSSGRGLIALAGAGAVSPSGTENTPQSTSQLPLGIAAPNKISGREFIANATVEEILTDYKKNISQQNIDFFVNPFGYGREAKDYAQRREGKVGRIFQDVIEKGKVNSEDIKYISEVAPKATQQLLSSVLKEPDVSVTDETIKRFVTDYPKVIDEAATKIKVENSNKIKIDVAMSLQSKGINPVDLTQDDYANKVSSEIYNQRQKELSDLESAYPIRKVQKVGNRQAYYVDERQNESEYKQKKIEIEKRYAQLNSEIGLSKAFDFAQRNPTFTPKEIGKVYLKYADSDTYKLYEKAGEGGTIDRDIAEVGVKALYGSGDNGAVALAKADEKRLDDQYPDKKKAEVLHKLGAELYKDENWFLNAAPNVEKLDKAAQQLTQEDREFYFKHIRETERRNIGTEVPMSGLVNKIGEGFGSTASETWKGLGDLIGARSEKSQAIESLNEGGNTRFQDVGTHAPSVQRLKELNRKQKSGSSLSAEEIEEKQNLETYTGVRSTGQEIIDGTGNLTGQVLFQAIGTKGLGSVANAGLKNIGLLKAANIASGLSVEESIAANALNFGVSKAAVNEVTAAAIAYASSYDSAKRDALRLMPDDKDADKRSLYANIVGGLNAGTERIFKDEKVLNAFNKEISPNVKRLVDQLASNKIEKTALATEMSNILSSSKQFLKEAGISNTQEATEELVTSVGQSVATSILAPTKFNEKQAFDDAVSTFTTTFLHGGLVAGFAGLNGYRANHIGIPTIARLGIDKKLTEDTRSFINGQLLSGDMSQNEANEKIQILNTAEKINTEIMPLVKAVSNSVIPPKAVDKYSVQLLNENILRKQAEDSSDPVLKSALEEKIKQSENIRKDILDKKLFIDDDYSVKDLAQINKEEIVVDESINTLSPQETITKAVNDEVITGVEADLIKQGTATPDDILLSLAKQKYGVSEDGSVFPEGGRDISMKTSLDVDEAVEKVYPNQQSVVDAIKKSTQPSIQPEGAAENVVPSTLEIPSDLQERGEEIISNDDAKSRFSNGERIFGFSEQDGNAVELLSVEDMDKYAPDQLLAYPSTPKQEVVSPVKSTPVIDRGTVVSTQEPAPVKGRTPVTLSGSTEQERQATIAKRKSETFLPGNIVDEQKLLSRVNSYNKKSGNYKRSVVGRSELNNIKTAVGNFNKTHNKKYTAQQNRAGDIEFKTSEGRKVKTNNRASGDLSIDEKGVPLLQRSEKVNDVFNQMLERDVFPTGYTVDGRRMDASQLEGTIQDILDGIPSRAANNYLDNLEKQIEADDFDFTTTESSDRRLMQRVNLDTILGTTREQQGEPMTVESVEAWLNEQGELTPEQEQIVIDNIENLMEDYEPETTTPASVQQTESTAETTTGEQAKPATESKTQSSEATPSTTVTETKQTEVKPTVESLTNELRSLLGNQPLPLNLTENLEISQDTRGKFYVTDVVTKEPISPAFDTKQQAQEYIDNQTGRVLALTGDANPKTRISFEDLGLTENENAESFIDKLIAHGGEFTNILKAIKADKNFKNVKLQLVNNRGGLENGESGLYYPVGYGEGMDNALQIANKDNVYYTGAHELMHFLTLDGDTANQIKGTTSYQALTDMYNYIAGKKGKPVAIAGGATIESYGLTNEKEFMAELLINPTFRKYVSDVFATNKDDIFKASKSIRDSKANSIVDIVANFFKDFFKKIFSSKDADVPFDERSSVVDNAVRLATQLFFAGENIISGQTDTGQGATVIGMAQEGLRSAALALPSTNRDQAIKEFIKNALGRGASEADIKTALINNGISDADAQAFIDDSKPQPQPQAKPKTSGTARTDNEVIATVLSQRVDARTFPTIFDDTDTAKQIAAITQGIGQNRIVDGEYVRALQTDLREVSMQSAKLLRDQLGADWGLKTLTWIEQNPSNGNLAQVVGVLNIISADNYQDIQNTHDSNKVRALQVIQNRIDKVSLQRARDSSLALNQRRLYVKFAQGDPIADGVADTILTPEVLQLKEDIEAALADEVTDDQINQAPPLKTNPKQSAIRKVTGAAKRKSNPSLKDELINKGAETANKTKKTFKELINDANDKLKNIKC